MVTFQTKYHGPTNTRGARIRAWSLPTVPRSALASRFRTTRAKQRRISKPFASTLSKTKCFILAESVLPLVTRKTVIRSCLLTAKLSSSEMSASSLVNIAMLHAWLYCAPYSCLHDRFVHRGYDVVSQSHYARESL